jgi:hypothetical protein
MNNIDLRNIDFRNPAVLIGAVVVLLVVVAIVAIVANRRKRRSEELRQRFGSEYDLVLREHGARTRAEARLLDRVRRVGRMQIRSLSTAERERFAAQWETVQSRFVDHPKGAVTEADELVNAVMLARGFPGGKFDQRVEDISVDHARLADSYRSANAIALRASRDEASTEELRNAMIHYRALFDELLEARTAAEVAAAEEAEPPLRRSA